MPNLMRTLLPLLELSFFLVCGVRSAPAVDATPVTSAANVAVSLTVDGLSYVNKVGLSVLNQFIGAV